MTSLQTYRITMTSIMTITRSCMLQMLKTIPELE